jgi:hypothetical protein
MLFRSEAATPLIKRCTRTSTLFGTPQKDEKLHVRSIHWRAGDCVLNEVIDTVWRKQLVDSAASPDVAELLRAAVHDAIRGIGVSPADRHGCWRKKKL